MDFADLRVFKAVVDEGGVSGAARKLHRVQSNVTTRVKQLEASLGTPLFLREKGRLHLSPAGKLFLGYVEQLLALSDEARTAVLGDAPSGVLRIGTLESTAASRLPPLLSRYHQRYPAVRVELVTGTTDALVDAVLRREIEAAFVADCVPQPEIGTLPAFEEELVVIASDAHPEVRKPQDVRADTLIAFPSGCAYRRRIQAWLASGGVALERTLELASYHAIIACVASGSGIAIVPRSVLATVRDVEGVSVHPLGARKGRTWTSLVWRKGDVSWPLRALQEEIAGTAESGAFRPRKKKGGRSRPEAPGLPV
jgi:DNA-binding transcriptional LysR family regulator